MPSLETRLSLDEVIPGLVKVYRVWEADDQDPSHQRVIVSLRTGTGQEVIISLPDSHAADYLALKVLDGVREVRATEQSCRWATENRERQARAMATDAAWKTMLETVDQWAPSDAPYSRQEALEGPVGLILDLVDDLGENASQEPYAPLRNCWPDRVLLRGVDPAKPGEERTVYQVQESDGVYRAATDDEVAAALDGGSDA